MDRRLFLTIASSGIFVPKFERWFKKLNGLIVPSTEIIGGDLLAGQIDTLLKPGLRKDFFEVYYNHSYEFYTFSLVNKELVLENGIYYDGKTGIKTTYQLI